MESIYQIVESMSKIEALEAENCSLPLVFTEILKDEINSNEEDDLYNGVKNVIKKYSKDTGRISAINEFFAVISGGASLGEIFQVTYEEILNPSLSTELTVDDTCRIERNDNGGKR